MRAFQFPPPILVENLPSWPWLVFGASILAKFRKVFKNLANFGVGPAKIDRENYTAFIRPF
jgi:hypothetical protein